MDEQEAAKHFEAVRSSSSVLPYVTKVRLPVHSSGTSTVAVMEQHS
jgi:hypothetical protein